MSDVQTEIPVRWDPEPRWPALIAIIAVEGLNFALKVCQLLATDLWSPPCARHWQAGSALDQAETLRYLPHRGGNVQQRPGVKKLVSGAYLIFYRVNEPARCVEVLRFWHGAQDPDRLRLR